MNSTKRQLLNRCKEYVDARISTARQSMDHAQQAANEESKSSAGDKYETGRAMMQIERDKAATQLEEALRLKAVLDQINPDVSNEKALLGSLVITSSKKIFISIGIGKFSLDGDDFLIVAPASPLGKALMGLKAKDRIVFNKEQIEILQIV